MTFGKRLAWPALHELSEYIALAHYQAASLVNGNSPKIKKRPHKFIYSVRTKI